MIERGDIERVYAGLAVERARFQLTVEVQARGPPRDRGAWRPRPAWRYAAVPGCRSCPRHRDVHSSHDCPQALLVPSVAFLDDQARWNLVLFLEKLPPDPSRFISVTRAGFFRDPGLSLAFAEADGKTCCF
jgi:hypothetical protein